MLTAELSSLNYIRQSLSDSWGYTDSLWDDSVSRSFVRDFVIPVERQHSVVEERVEELVRVINIEIVKDSY